jgi:hypothetical protein
MNPAPGSGQFGPNHAAVDAFIARLAGLDDEGLWDLEAAIFRLSRDDGQTGRWVAPDTRWYAEAHGRLLAWYEAGHYAAEAVRPRRDGSVVADLPGESTEITVPGLRQLAPVVAQALVVGDLVTEHNLRSILARWPSELLPIDPAGAAFSQPGTGSMAHEMSPSTSSRRPTIAEAQDRVTEWLRQTAMRAGIALPAGVAGLPVKPCHAPTPPPYGTRTGTWGEAASFIREWAQDGRDWVNIGLHVSPTGEPYFCYEVPDRGSPGEPLEEGCAPSINLHGPARDRDA